MVHGVYMHDAGNRNMGRNAMKSHGNIKVSGE